MSTVTFTKDATLVEQVAALAVKPFDLLVLNVRVQGWIIRRNHRKLDLLCGHYISSSVGAINILYTMMSSSSVPLPMICGVSVSTLTSGSVGAVVLAITSSRRA